MNYAIDGNNLLLGLRINKKPSTRAFARVLVSLLEKGHTFKLFFDNSIAKILERDDLSGDWDQLRNCLRDAGIDPQFESHADPHIQDYCLRNSAALINSRDKLDSWKYRPKIIHRGRLRRKGRSFFALVQDEIGNNIIHDDVVAPFKFGDFLFQRMSSNTATVEPSIAPDPEPTNVQAEGVLLVLALDASQSMGTNDTFDGQSKASHLNNVVRQSLHRLRNSRIADGLFLAVLRFENDVTPIYCNSDATFSSINEWYSRVKDFDYLDGIALGQTNIRLVLQRSKELIQNAISDTHGAADFPESWRAAIILITDGNHYITRKDGAEECNSDVMEEILEIHEGLSGIIGGRIDIGCVGIGNDVNRDFLTNIASGCTPTQKAMARRAGMASMLVKDRLSMFVDSNARDFGGAIRTFIDVASGSN